MGFFIPFLVKGAAVTAAYFGGKSFYDAANNQVKNLDEQADAERTYTTNLFDSSLKQLDQSLSGYQGLITKWQSAGFLQQIGRQLFDAVVGAFGGKTITQQLNEAHNMVDQADDMRRELRDSFTKGMDTLGRDNIVEGLIDKYKETLGFGDKNKNARQQERDGWVKDGSRYNSTSVNLTRSMNQATGSSNIVTMPENEMGQTQAPKVKAQELNYGA